MRPRHADAWAALAERHAAAERQRERARVGARTGAGRDPRAAVADRGRRPLAIG
jgi:hypothetical protein